MTSLAVDTIDEGKSLFREGAKGRLTKGSVSMLNIVPMLDILFNLLIFFLCFGLALTPEGALPAKLPASHGAAKGTIPLTPIEIRLDVLSSGLHVQMRPQRVQLASMADLYERMKVLVESRDFGADVPVILVPSPEVPMSYVADAYNAVLQAGFKEIVFGEKTEEAAAADGNK